MTTTRRALLLGCLLISGCADSPLPAGAVCKATADCDTDLMCLDVAQFSGTACTVVGKSCSKTCTDDPSCASLGANFRCFATCTADKACEMVAGP
jgi:hypothetical protein